MMAQTHVILSPHPDDAVLSCGGLMFQLAQAGHLVQVRTVMAGSMPPDVVMSPFIEEHLVRWGVGADPAPARRAEDQHAVAVLGAQVVFYDLPDALYRTDGAGTALYPDLVQLFGPVHPADPAADALDTITAGLDTAAVVYAPLGAGGHVDHRLVRDAVLRWLPVSAPPTADGVAVFFYEEYPYSAGGDTIIEAARKAIDHPLVPLIQRISGAALDAKIRAIGCHVSQISTFWTDTEAMAAAVRAYALEIGQAGFAERLWHFA